MADTWLYFCCNAMETAGCLRTSSSGFTSREGVLFGKEHLSFASSGSQSVPQSSARLPAGTPGFSAEGSGTTRGKHRSTLCTSRRGTGSGRAGERAGGGNRRAGGDGLPRGAPAPRGSGAGGAARSANENGRGGSHGKIDGKGGGGKETKKEKERRRKRKGEGEEKEEKRRRRRRKRRRRRRERRKKIKIKIKIKKVLINRGAAGRDAKVSEGTRVLLSLRPAGTALNFNVIVTQKQLPPGSFHLTSTEISPAGRKPLAHLAPKEPALF